MTRQTVGAQIRALRERRGLTRDALAAMTDLSAVYLKKIEAGERIAPSFPTLARIAKALGTTLRIELVEPAPRRRQRKGGP
jgi:XRE family transcriptional regulator of biofilm formation